MLKRTLSCVLAILLAAAPLFLTPALAAEEVISLSTPQDVARLAEACAYDGYSRGKKVVLMNDIDMAGTECQPIEVFCGAFEGNGHAIRGLSFSFQDSGKGFFCTVEQEAAIRDLTVELQIAAARKEEGTSSSRFLSKLFKNLGGLDKLEGSQSLVTLGGLVGTNHGLLTGCTVEGNIQGEEQVGGLAGLNSRAGRIEACINNAKLTGTNNVGGLAGKNEGCIKTGTNNGEVCTESNEDTNCAGGIAGVSSGVIKGCTNNGTVGYKGFGNNIGGIAGKQNGCITECINNGSVYGGKGVGGIAGRFDPYTNLDISYESVKQDVQNQLSTMKNDVETSKNKIYDYAGQLVSEVTDFSGLAGKLLPELSGAGSIAGSGRNLLDRAADAADAAAGALDKAGSAADRTGSSLEEAGDAAQDTLQGIRDTMDKAADDISGEVRDNLRDTSSSLRSTLETVQSSADKFGNLSSDITQLIDELTDAVSSGKDNQQEIIDRLNGKLDELDGDVLDPLTKDLKQTQKVVQRTLNSIRSDVSQTTDALIAPLEKLDTILGELIRQASAVKNQVQKLKEKLDALLGKLPNLPDIQQKSSTGESQNPQPDTPAITGWLGMTTVYADSLDATQEEIRERLEDVASSDMPMPRIVAGELTDTALIKYCANTGSVEGNEAIGGIAGIMSVESAVKSGDNLTLPDGQEVGSTSVVKAAVESCINQGAVTAKNQNAGGIAGQADLGTLRDCLVSAKVDAEEGCFGGGIAGNSTASIDFCIAIADVHGKSDLGGVAGKAKTIRQCYALPRLTVGADRSGAIAGSLTGKAVQNYFIDEGLTGINGGDYVGSAEPRSPQDMTGTSSIPPGMGGFADEDWLMGTDDLYLPQIRALAENNGEFISAYLSAKSADLARFHFSATFCADGETLKVIPLEYGQKIPPEEIPHPQSKDGFVPVWDPDVNQPVIRHTVYQAVYNKATTTIATAEEPPLMLVEGNFSDNARLHAEPTEIAQEFDGYRKQSAYSFSITPAEDAGTLRVHIRDTGNKEAAIGIVPNGSPQVVSCERDGSYLVFEVDRAQPFVILYQKSFAPLIWSICAAVGALGLGLGGFWLWRRKKRQIGTSKTEEELYHEE